MNKDPVVKHDHICWLVEAHNKRFVVFDDVRPRPAASVSARFCARLTPLPRTKTSIKTIQPFHLKKNYVTDSRRYLKTVISVKGRSKGERISGKIS